MIENLRRENSIMVCIYIYTSKIKTLKNEDRISDDDACNRD